MTEYSNFMATYTTETGELNYSNTFIGNIITNRYITIKKNNIMSIELNRGLNALITCTIEFAVNESEFNELFELTNQVNNTAGINEGRWHSDLDNVIDSTNVRNYKCGKCNGEFDEPAWNLKEDKLLCPFCSKEMKGLQKEDE